MWNIIKQIVGSIIGIVIAIYLVTTLYGIPNNISLLVLIGLGVILSLIGILSNTKRSSRIRVGAINRAEFYGVVVAMVGYMLYMNTRIDQIMLILIR